MTPFEYTCRVYYEDTDAGGIVYHANYLRFMERARTEWLCSLEFGDLLFSDYAEGFAIRSVQIDYLYPARLGDQLKVTARLHSARKVSLVMEQEVININTGRLLCKAEVHGVYAGKKMRPRAIPISLLEALKGEKENA